MSSDVECITLDDSDDDSKVALHQQLQQQKRRSLGNVGNYGDHGVSGHRSAGVRTGAPPPLPGVISVGAGREETMMRCNLCVDPGLLPVEEDRGAHR